MTRLIRHAVFETNSSSAHSISIPRHHKELLDTIYPDENGVIELCGNDYGWGHQTYNDAYDKACYLATYFTNYDSSAPNDVFIDVLKEHTGAREIKFNVSDYAYIDHQSVAEHFNYSDPALMKQYLFNPRAILYIDNDNDEMYNQSGVSGLYVSLDNNRTLDAFLTSRFGKYEISEVFESWNSTQFLLTSDDDKRFLISYLDGTTDDPTLIAIQDVTDVDIPLSSFDSIGDRMKGVKVDIEYTPI